MCEIERERVRERGERERRGRKREGERKMEIDRYYKGRNIPIV